MCYTYLLVVLIRIIFVVTTSVRGQFTIEQTIGYEDTWFNMNATCSLLGKELTGDLWEDRVTVWNTEDIIGTGWISAHIEHRGTLEFVGCMYGTVPPDTPRLMVTQDRIPQCIYFCKSSRFVLHQDYCYCSQAIIFEHTISPCIVSPCSNNETLLCGQSKNYKAELCMCQYQNQSMDVNSSITGESCRFSDVQNCVLYPGNQSKWVVECDNNCIFHWNGYVKREVFIWGTLPSDINNGTNCVAIRRLHSTTKLTIVSLPCSSKHTGICKQGTRITPQTKGTSTVSISTSSEYEMPTTKLTSVKLSQYTSVKLLTHHSTKNINHYSQPHTTTSKSLDESALDTQTGNILGPILGGIGAILILILIGIIIVCVLIKIRRRKADTRSKGSRELDTLSLSKQRQKQYITSTNEKENHGVDSGAYDSLQTTKTESKNAGYDLYDHKSGSVDNTYGRLNQNGRGIVSQENADIYDHSRIVNGDTYDSFQTGVGREDCSDDYYDHTSVGENYGHLEKGDKRKGQIDDIYDHSRGNGQNETYDTFQKLRGHPDVSGDYYDHTGVSIEYGYLQKGGKIKVQGDNDYDTMNVVKGYR